MTDHKWKNYGHGARWGPGWRCERCGIREDNAYQPFSNPCGKRCIGSGRGDS